jgi:hypothetical protein
MKRILLAVAIVTWVWIGAALETRAQMVQVTPGYVRAPFVRVYTGPGGTQVRAPFVDVQAPGFRRFERPAVPTAEELSQLDWANLRLAVRELSLYFDSQLSTLATGDGWKVHLKTAEIRALVREGSGPPTVEVFQKLAPILTAYDAVAINPAYRSIADLDGFRALRDALGEVLAPPSRRAGRQLTYAALELNRSLEQAGAEAAWQTHLALPRGLAPSQDVPPPDTAPPSVEDLAKVLARFDAVSRNPDYRRISQLPAFRVTHERLADYVALSKAEQAVRPKPEELPVPR